MRILGFEDLPLTVVVIGIVGRSSLGCFSFRISVLTSGDPDGPRPRGAQGRGSNGGGSGVHPCSLMLVGFRRCAFACVDLWLIFDWPGFLHEKTEIRFLPPDLSVWKCLDKQTGRAPPAGEKNRPRRDREKGERSTHFWSSSSASARVLEGFGSARAPRGGR